MNATLAGILFLATLVIAIALSYRPLGDYMARVFMGKTHWRAERVIYRAIGVNPDADQKWSTYLRSMLAFSLLSVLGLYVMLRAQHHLPYLFALFIMLSAEGNNGDRLRHAPTLFFSSLPGL